MLSGKTGEFLVLPNCVFTKAHCFIQNGNQPREASCTSQKGSGSRKEADRPGRAHSSRVSRDSSSRKDQSCHKIEKRPGTGRRKVNGYGDRLSLIIVFGVLE